MKRILLLFIFLTILPFSLFGYGIVDNTATRDTLSIPFVALDSIGNQIDLASGDSVYIVIFYPGGGVAFKDSMACNDASISGYDWEDFSGGKSYVYTERISVLDGSGAVNGVYSYILSVDDNTSADLITTSTGTFQVVTSTLETSLDSAGIAAANSADALDSLGTIIDSLNAVLDTLQNQDNWIGNIRYSHTDSILNLRGLHIRGTAGNDTALIAHGYGSGIGGSFYGGSSNGHGLYSNGQGNGCGFVSVSGTGNGSGFYAIGYGTGHGFFAEATSTGDGAFWKSSAGNALRLWANGSGDGINIFSLNGDDIEADITGDLSGQVGSVEESVLVDISANLAFADTIANRVLEDSLSYTGSGGDSISIARWVWNTPHNNHTTGETFGKYLDTEISGLGSGSGIYACEIITFDSTIDQVIPGVNIVIRNKDQTALIALGTSSLSGKTDFNLNADTFIVAAFSPGYMFSSFDSLIVNGVEVDTIYGCQFNPGEPSSPDLCRLYGFLYDITGQPEEGAIVTAWLPSGVSRNGDNIISPFKAESISNSSGYFYLDLIPSEDLNPASTKYEIIITRSDGAILRERIIVPAQSDWLLTW